MNLVYCPQASPGSLTALDENEFHHVQVLRMKEGEAVKVFDGKGNLYQGVLANLAKKSAMVQVTALLKADHTPGATLHIAIAPTKNIERMEWFLEKVTEIGVHMITPVICRRSERRELRHDRLEKVILSAAKQSLHLHLPKLNETMSLKEFLMKSKNDSSKKFIGYCEEKTSLLKNSFKPHESICVLIGPEGDFTEEEVNDAKAASFIPISLGDSRLRTETAGMMVSAIFNLAQGK